MKRILELNLLLLYLSGWEEESRNDPDSNVFRSWKGYLFDILHDLEQDGLITQFRNTKSVIITEKGIQKAKTLNAIVLLPVEKAS